MKSLDISIYEINKYICNYFNPKQVCLIKYVDNKNVYIKIYLRKVFGISDNNFREFFKNKSNSRFLGGILKKLSKDYNLIPVRGSYFKGFYNPDNWVMEHKDFIEYTYYLTKSP